jgi:hypothetical protein
MSKRNKQKTLPEELADAVKIVEDHTGVNVKRETAWITMDAYRQAAAAAIAVPLTVGAVGVQVPTIATQQPAKRPEEHLPSQNQAPANTVGGMGHLVTAASTSSESFTLVDHDGSKVYYTIGRKNPPKS